MVPDANADTITDLIIEPPQDCDYPNHYHEVKEHVVHVGVHSVCKRVQLGLGDVMASRLMCRGAKKRRSDEC